MLNTAKNWALNVLMVGLVGVCMVGAGLGVSQFLLYLRQSVWMVMS